MNRTDDLTCADCGHHLHRPKPGPCGWSTLEHGVTVPCPCPTVADGWPCLNCRAPLYGCGYGMRRCCEDCDHPRATDTVTYVVGERDARKVPVPYFTGDSIPRSSTEPGDGNASQDGPQPTGEAVPEGSWRVGGWSDEPCNRPCGHRGAHHLSPSTGEDRLREAAQDLVDGLDDALISWGDYPNLEELHEALRAALTPTGDTPKEQS